MHPLQTYLRNLKIAALDPPDHKKSLHALAETIGVTVGFLSRLHYPNQSKLSPERALRLELATNGLVPAASVCAGFKELMILIAKVDQMRENNRIPQQ